MKVNAGRLKIMLLVITLILAGIIGYMFYFNVTKGEVYEQKALRQYTNRYDTELYPMRGTIVDRNMKEIATSIPVYNVVFDPYVLSTSSRKEEVLKENIERTLNELNRLFGVPRSKLEEYLETDENGELLTSVRYLRLEEAKGISRTEADILKDLELPGVWTEEDSKRTYPYGSLGANVIGFIRGDTSWGIENYYNEQLTGEEGRSFITYSTSQESEENVIPARDGYKVITTLDMTLQGYAEEALKNAIEAYEPQNGAIIVLNQNTGEILAMAMYPSFDPNTPDKPNFINDEALKEIWSGKSEKEKIDDLNRAWKNYCITSVFEPGSIFKPVLVAAALDDGVISLNDTFYCGGNRQVYDRNISCHFEPGHGVQTVEEVLANSCNLAMIDIVYKMGAERFYDHFKNFGFGEKTEIDLPGEENAQYQVFSKEDFKNPVNLATSSFGQGPACTSIQALNAFAAIINGGEVKKPYVVSQIIDEKGNVILSNKPTTVRKIISNETSDTVRVMLKSVVDNGTGKKAQIPGYSIGGKTGTAEQGVRNKKDHTLTFIGFLPVENPEFVALALLDKPKDSTSQGSATAAPMLKEFLEKAIQYYGIKPSNEDEVAEDTFIAEDSVAVPDLEDMTMTEATEMLVSCGLRYEDSGEGNVVTTHWPKPGTKVTRGTTITLYTKLDENMPKTIAVPDVIGLSYDDALKTLINNSFVVVVDSDDIKDKVVSWQEPRPGLHASPETDVVLTFSTPVKLNE